MKGVEPDDVRHGGKAVELAGALVDLRDHAAGHLDKALTALASGIRAPNRPFYRSRLSQPYLKGARQASPYGPVVEVAAWKKPLILWRLDGGFDRHALALASMRPSVLSTYWSAPADSRR